jgi:hypothetical protein
MKMLAIRGLVCLVISALFASILTATWQINTEQENYVYTLGLLVSSFYAIVTLYKMHKKASKEINNA